MVFLKDQSLVLYSSFYTPLLLVQSYLNHQQIITTTQLLSFVAADFSYNITYLENTISNVHNWMSSNFLSLNPSKTEFLIIGLPQQLSKLRSPTIHLPNDVTLTPVDSARNWVSSLTTISHSLNTSQLLLNHVFMTSVISGVYVILLI